MLSTKPCCADNDCKAEFYKKNGVLQKTPIKGDTCPGCSPFFTCGTCVGFIVVKPFTISLPVIAEDQMEYHADYQQPHIEKVTIFLWLPPKIS